MKNTTSILLLIPEKDKRDLKREAEKKGLSLNGYIRMIIRERKDMVKNVIAKELERRVLEAIGK